MVVNCLVLPTDNPVKWNDPMNMNATKRPQGQRSKKDRKRAKESIVQSTTKNRRQKLSLYPLDLGTAIRAIVKTGPAKDSKIK